MTSGRSTSIPRTTRKPRRTSIHTESRPRRRRWRRAFPCGPSRRSLVVGSSPRDASAIYRAPMRAREVDVPAGAGAEYGLEQGLVGIGTGADERSARRLHRFATVPDGAFVWTRDRAGGYHLGRICGPVREDGSPAAQRVGIRHVRPTQWLETVFDE